MSDTIEEYKCRLRYERRGTGMTDENRFFVRMTMFAGIIGGALLGWWFALVFLVLWVGVSIYEQSQEESHE